MTSTGKTAQRFLEHLNSKETKETFNLLAQLVESLETKGDPEPTEVRLAANIYDFIERLKTLEQNMRSFVKESNMSLPGSKLATLIENTSYDGNHFFRD